MEMAIRAVKDGRCKIKEATREYDVSRTTLRKWKSSSWNKTRT